jgi:hypothetical protein
VEFTEEPTEHAYGTDIALRDPFGNHLRIVQLPAQPDGTPASAGPKSVSKGR